jgi:hypothetical protein
LLVESRKIKAHHLLLEIILRAKVGCKESATQIDIYGDVSLEGAPSGFEDFLDQVSTTKRAESLKNVVLRVNF